MGKEPLAVQTELGQVRSKPDDQSDPNLHLVLATAIQDALIRAIGPNVWLSTGSVLYMRVSYIEAGALIGSEGIKIKHLIQTTGAQIHIGKVCLFELI